jgi:hypothetical protein
VTRLFLFCGKRQAEDQIYLRDEARSRCDGRREKKNKKNKKVWKKFLPHNILCYVRTSPTYNLPAFCRAAAKSITPDSGSNCIVETTKKWTEEECGTKCAGKMKKWSSSSMFTSMYSPYHARETGLLLACGKRVFCTS